MADVPSSPPAGVAKPEEALAWYKAQYEQLVSDLAEFRESSTKLENELEKDIEEAEERERTLRERAEDLRFEVEEWKRKCKESKSEANTAQHTLEKEVTTLRDANRTLQLRLRDIEVANDDFERQARNTTSSLEDMESKYNVAVERAVMLEEEIKVGEQERETLRIEAQRLKEEFNDLKIEAELQQDKIKKYEERHLSTISTDISVLESPTFDQNVETSPNSATSSPLITTPPPPGPKSLSGETIPELNDPPSPPMSDASAPLPKASSAFRTPAAARPSRLPSSNHRSVTPKPRSKPPTTTSASRVPGARSATTGPTLRTPAPAPASRSTRVASNRVPGSKSLTQIRSLTAQMQRLEARVHNARSKLPGPSPRNSLGPVGQVPSSVTIRSRKRGPGSTASSLASEEPTPTGKHVPRLSTSGIGRLSFGPLPNRTPGADSDASFSRPSSRASAASSSMGRPPSRTDMVPPPRPMSRTSGARTPIGRPRSSLGGSLHGHSASLSGRRSVMNFDETDEDTDEFRTSARAGAYGGGGSGARVSLSGIPVPGSRRQSGTSANGFSISLSRRSTSGNAVTTREGPGRPPSRLSKAESLEDLGETY